MSRRDAYYLTSRCIEFEKSKIYIYATVSIKNESMFMGSNNFGYSQIENTQSSTFLALNNYEPGSIFGPQKTISWFPDS